MIIFLFNKNLINLSENKIKLPVLSANQYARKAEDLVKKGETIAAIEYYRKAIELEPELPLRVYKGLGNALVKQKLLEEAVEVFSTAIQRFPNRPFFYASLGDVFAQKGDPENAIKQYRKAFDLDSNQPLQVYQKLGNQLLKSNQLEAAEAVFKQLSEKYSERPQGYDGLARIAMRSQQLEVAQQRWQKVLDLFPDHIPAWVGLGNIFIEQGKLEEAEKLFQNLTEKYLDKPQGYAGLVRVAMRSQQWEVAVEKLDLAISFFPEKPELVLQKINVLLKIPLFENAEIIIRQEKSRFLDDFRLDLAEANLYKQQFNYQAAQKILEIASLKYPDNIKIQLERADNYCQLGQEEAAQKILTLILPEIWIENLPFIIRFTKIYVKILLRENKIDALKEYFDEARSHQVFNQEVLMNYYQVLMSQGMYQEASQLLEEMIREKVFTPKIYQDKISLLFELEKTKNIQKITQLKSVSELESKVGEEREPLLENIKSYLKSHLKFETFNTGLLKIFDKINQLSQQYQNTYFNTYTSPFEAYRVALKIIDHIQNKTPLSLIRLGDGEGNFIDYQKEWQQFQEKDRETIQRTWWGCVRIDQNEWQKLKGDYVSAIQNADIIGIPEFYRFCRSFRIQLIEKNQTLEFRGLITIIHTLLNPSFYPEQNRIHSSDYSLTSCHIHHNLETWGLYQLIFNQIQDCSVISCHEEVSQFLQEQHGVTVKKFYKIPSEYKYSQLFDYNDQNNEPHYPDYFQQICSEITVSYQGEVFLVAAGFLGKIYCNLIKMKGGIALDVGSIADYWLNYTTRSFTQFPNQINYGSIFSQLIEQQNTSSQTKDSKSVKNESNTQRITARDNEKKDWEKLASDFAKKKKWEEAIACYQKAIQFNYNNPLLYLRLGNTWRNHGESVEAIACYQKAIELKHQNPRFYHQLGDTYREQLRLDEAMIQYQKGLEIAPEDYKLHLRLAGLLQHIGKLSEAIALYEKAIKLQPHQFNAYNQLAVIYFSQAEIKTAIAVYQKAFYTNPNSSEAYSSLAQFQLRYLQNFGVALINYQKAIDLDDQYFPAYTGKGNVLIQLGQLNQAEKLFERLAHLFPDQPDGLAGQARVAQHRQNYQVTLEIWEKVIQKFPDYFPGYRGKGLVEIKLGQFEEAEATFTELSHKFPRRPEGLCGLSQVAECSQQYELALERWEKVIKTFPNHAIAHQYRANTLTKLERFQEAEAKLEQFIELPEACLGLGELHTKLGNFEKAIEYFRKALQPRNSHQVYSQLFRLFLRTGDLEGLNPILNDFVEQRFLCSQNRTVNDIVSACQLAQQGKFEAAWMLYKSAVAVHHNFHLKYFVGNFKLNSLIFTLSALVLTQASLDQGRCDWVEKIIDLVERNQTVFELQHLVLSTIHLYLGIHHQQDNQYSLALSSLKQSLVLNPDSQSCLPRIQHILQQQHNTLSTSLFPAQSRKIVLMIITCQKYRDKIQPLREKLYQKLKIPYCFIIGDPNLDSDWSWEDDILYVKCPDNYESLPLKVLKALEFFYCCCNFEGVLKLDDDCWINNGEKFLQVIDWFEQDCPYDYAGAIINHTLGRAWHFRKCESSSVTTAPYDLPFVSAWCSGGSGYFVSRKSLKVLFEYTTKYPGVLRGELYEDVLVGKILYLHGIKPHQFDLAKLGLINLEVDPRLRFLEAKTYLKSGENAASEGKIEIAIECFQKALSIEPDQPIRIYKRLSQLLVELNQSEQAITVLQVALDKFPNHANLYIQLGNLFLDQGLSTLAVDQYEKAINLNPDHSTRIDQVIRKVKSGWVS